MLTWNQIAEALAAAAGLPGRHRACPVGGDRRGRPGLGRLLGDKAHSLVFDNSKLRSVVPGYRAVIPFEQGAREIVAWYDEDPARQQVDARLDAVMDALEAAHRA